MSLIWLHMQIEMQAVWNASSIHEDRGEVDYAEVVYEVSMDTPLGVHCNLPEQATNFLKPPVMSAGGEC